MAFTREEEDGIRLMYEMFKAQMELDRQRETFRTTEAPLRTALQNKQKALRDNI